LGQSQEPEASAVRPDPDAPQPGYGFDHGASAGADAFSPTPASVPGSTSGTAGGLEGDGFQGNINILLVGAGMRSNPLAVVEDGYHGGGDADQHVLYRSG